MPSGEHYEDIRFKFYNLNNPIITQNASCLYSSRDLSDLRERLSEARDARVGFLARNRG